MTVSRPVIIVLGVAALIGGVLRLISTFLPYTPGDADLETLYNIIDLFLFAGTIGIWFGWAQLENIILEGLKRFALLLTAFGFLAILGPDWFLAGQSVYLLGSSVIAIGLFLMALVMIISGEPRFFLVRYFFLAVLTVPLIAPYLDQEAAGFMIAGLMLGFGYVFAGLSLIFRKS